jgi:hypothetical protein
MGEGRGGVAEVNGREHREGRERRRHGYVDLPAWPNTGGGEGEREREREKRMKKTQPARSFVKATARSRPISLA